MRLSPRVWLVAALFAVGVGGLTLPGLAGQVCAYAWLGVFPGMALVRFLAPRAGAATRWTLGLALSPLASATIGWAILGFGQPLGTAARLAAVVGWILFAGGEARDAATPPDDEEDPPFTRFVWLWIAAAVTFVAVPVLANHWLLIRSDGWVHGALAWEIVNHGVPPMDPRFAGMKLNYVWFFNLYTAMLTSLRGQDPFVFMALFNVVNTGVLMALAWLLGWAIWKEQRAAIGALVLFTLGLNAGAWLLWPLSLVRALKGDVRGWAEVQRQLAHTHLGSTEVLYALQAPFASMVNFWDKFTLGTPLGYANLLLLVYWWALARWLAGDGPRWLATGALAAAGMMLFHGVIGLSAIPVSIGALALVALLGLRTAWLPARGRIAAFAGATLLGLAACVPYTRSIAAGWDAKQSGMAHSLFQLGWVMPWTILTACGVTLWLTRGAIRRLVAERRGFAAWLACWALGMVAFACVVHLPESNEHKFVFPLHAALAMLGGAALLPVLDAARARLGRVAVGVVFALLFVVPQALFLYGYLADQTGRTAEALNPAPGEEKLYAWMRTRTPLDAVFTDHHSRDLVMVKGQRRLLAGTTFGPERAAFPLAELERRRAVMADLYGAGVRLDDDTALLLGLGKPAFVLYRLQDYTGGEAPWTALEADSTRFARVYEADGFRVYQLLRFRS